MKLSPSIQVKKTVKLFSNIYQYKVVIKTPCATWFRKGLMDVVFTELDHIDKTGKIRSWFVGKNVRSKKDIEYVRKLYPLLSASEGFLIRVEHPLMSIYTNDETLIERIAAIDADNIKYVSLPDVETIPMLKENVVLVKNIDYDYKVHIGPSTQSFENFIQWCNNNDKIRLTVRIKRELTRSKSWGGSYCYVKDEKTLTIVRMFIGSIIHKIERVIKV